MFSFMKNKASRSNIENIFFLQLEASICDMGEPRRCGSNIPININVVNNNAPSFISGPFVNNLQQTATVGSRVMCVTANDPDFNVSCFLFLTA